MPTLLATPPNLPYSVCRASFPGEKFCRLADGLFIFIRPADAYWPQSYHIFRKNATPYSHWGSTAVNTRNYL